MSQTASESSQTETGNEHTSCLCISGCTCDVAASKNPVSGHQFTVGLQGRVSTLASFLEHRFHGVR